MTEPTADTEPSNNSSSDSEDVIDDIARHPISFLWKQWKRSNKKERQEFDFDGYRHLFDVYLQEIQNEPHCIDVFHTGRERKCTCMRDLKFDESTDELERVVNALIRFGMKTKLERNQLMGEWIRYAEAYQGDTKRLLCYLLPGGNQFICQHALARVCGMKSYAWRGLCKKVRAGQSLEHGLVGKKSNRSNSDVNEWMDCFLSNLEEQGAPRATRLVRFINKDGNSVQENRDDDDNLIDLPPHCTKLGLYKQFIAERGWRYIYDPKNRILDKVAIEGMEQEPTDPSFLPSVKTFLLYWQKNFPHMRIQKASADICDECFVFANQVRYKERATGKEGVDALVDDEEDGSIPSDAVKESEAEGLKAEAIILAAAEHVQKQKKQRDLFNRLKAHARNNFKRGKSAQIHTFVADYSQNLSVPNFAGEQPGKAYYLSPLNAFVFGIVDCSNVKTTLSAHTYFEMDGKKGGNNVASMLWNELGRKGLRSGAMVQQINIVMDNCGGQNKNRMVIRLLFVLVKLRYCFKAQMVFLVKGHTKNDCDRMFNLMKKNYRKTNCYTPKQLLQFVGESNEDVELVDVMNGGGGFKDWDKYQNIYMKAPDSIQTFHVFTVSSLQPNRLVCQEASGYPAHYDDNIVRKQFRDQPWASDLQQELDDIPPPGIKDIKWITLYDDWRPLIPLDYRTDFRFFHEDPGTERREKSKLNRGEAAANRKKRSVTHDNDQKPAAVPRKRKKPATKAAPKAAKAAPKAASAKAAASKAAAAKAVKPATKKARGPFIL
jgi:hypothetical protein